MEEFFPGIEKIRYEGPLSRNPLAFKEYSADELTAGKPMKEHLRFALSWWHTICSSGTDMFGAGTVRRFGRRRSSRRTVRWRSSC